jgi:hypothetical protein
MRNIYRLISAFHRLPEITLNLDCKSTAFISNGQGKISFYSTHLHLIN